MITARPIANGSTYLGNHLRANDYYAEGESVQGQWWGQGAERLGLRGRVEEPQFEALRTNRHPIDGTKLTARNRKKNAFHDITINAPKSVSILAVVGQDERVREAFKESVNVALTELEKHAAVRERTGSNASTNNTRPTGNVIAAVFHHDSSRLLDPQLHAHAVLTNATYDPERQRWFALQPKPMMEASPPHHETLSPRPRPAHREARLPSHLEPRHPPHPRHHQGNGARLLPTHPTTRRLHPTLPQHLRQGA